MIPVEIEEPSRLQYFREDANNEEQRADLDLIQEIRDHVQICEHAAK